MLVKANILTKLRNKGISVFYGDVYSKEHFRAFLHGEEEFIRFCVINGVKSVLVSPNERDLVESIDFDKIKRQLAEEFDSEMESRIGLVYRFITKEYYKPAIESVYRLLEEDREKYTNILGKSDLNSMEDCEVIVDEENDMFETDVVESVFLFALVNGGTVDHLIVFDEDEQNDENDTIPSEEELYRGYTNHLHSKIVELMRGAAKENERILIELKEDLLGKIKEEIMHEGKLSHLVTQKARNEYADMICVRWQSKGDYEWLTKRDVRSLVEKEYYANNNATGFTQLTF